MNNGYFPNGMRNQLFAAGPGCLVHQNRLHHLAGRPISQLYRYAFRRQVPVSPGEQSHHHRKKIKTLRRQPVFVPRGAFVVSEAFEKAVIGQMLKPSCQDVGCNAKVLLEFVEAGEPWKASRRIRMLHHSPTRSSARAAGHSIFLKLVRRIMQVTLSA